MMFWAESNRRRCWCYCCDVDYHLVVVFFCLIEQKGEWCWFVSVVCCCVKQKCKDVIGEVIRSREKMTIIIRQEWQSNEILNSNNCVGENRLLLCFFLLIGCNPLRSFSPLVFAISINLFRATSHPNDLFATNKQTNNPFILNQLIQNNT